MFQDKVLVCDDCGEEFTFTAGEQEFYAEKGFTHDPKKCKACRDKRKAASKAPREIFTSVCAKCGGEAKTPFQPTNDKPVYCSTCYDAIRAMRAEQE